MQWYQWVLSHHLEIGFAIMASVATVSYVCTFLIMYVFDEPPEAMKNEYLSDFVWMALFIFMPLVPLVQGAWGYYLVNWLGECKDKCEQRKLKERKT